MLDSDPVRDTARDYPWAKVFFGFVGGMLLFNFVAHLLGSIKLSGILLRQLLLPQPATDKMYLYLLWGLLFLFPVLLGSIATALFLVWRNARRNRHGVMLAVKSMLALNTIYAVFIIIYLVFWGEFRNGAHILFLVFSCTGFVLLQGIFAALLASWLLPEPADDEDEAEFYPWQRVILGFGLGTGLLNGLLFWLLLLILGKGISWWHLPDNMGRFFMPGFLFGAWFAWRRFQRSLRHMVFILVVTLPLAMFYFMGITSASFSYSMHLRSLPMILTARLALAILILSFVLLPAREDRTASAADNGVLLLVSLLAAAIIIVVSAWMMPYVLIILWRLFS